MPPGLREALQALRPRARWLEEEYETSALPHGEWWVVDNAEGSVNHVHGMPEWGVSITLVPAAPLPPLTAHPGPPPPVMCWWPPPGVHAAMVRALDGVS